MFGGIAFMLNGNMCCGVTGADLMLRLGNEGAAAALGESHTRPMDFTGRPMKSMVFVDAGGIRGDDDLRGWVMRAVDFAGKLPAAPGKLTLRTNISKMRPPSGGGAGSCPAWRRCGRVG